MPVQEDVVITDSALVTVALEPAHNAIHSLLLLLKAECLLGFGDWMTHTADALSPAERQDHHLVLLGLHHAVVPERSWPSFPAYLDHLAALDPVALRDKMLQVYAQMSPCSAQQDGSGDVPPPVDWDEVLKDAASYVEFLRSRFGPANVDEEVETRAYGYVLDPPAMQALIVSHLRQMWDKYLAAEWERVIPMLRDAVRAFQQVDLSGMTRFEAAQVILDRELDREEWERKLESVERVTFVPSAHVGPYLGKLWSGRSMWVLFGARLPRGGQVQSPDLSRAEIAVRLGALADDINLRILELVMVEEELSSPEIMSRLDLSQSAASRHLTQLTATGYLFERRCSGAKCYRLNPERVEDTLRAIAGFLLGDPVRSSS